MTIVVATPVDQPSAMPDAFLPPTRTVTNGRMIFRFYDTNEASSDREFRDPIDGSLLIAYKSFATVADADAWIASQVGAES